MDRGESSICEVVSPFCDISTPGHCLVPLGVYETELLAKAVTFAIAAIEKYSK
jgi:hypothetical protein